MAERLELRDVSEADLERFFVDQLDPDANYLAAFTAKDPSDKAAFLAHWSRILSTPTIMKQAILLHGELAGHILSFEEDGRREVSYWVGRQFWGKGVASGALARFLQVVQTRPLYARVAYENPASLRVLQKCGFVIYGEEQGFAHGRGREVGEFLLRLDG